MAYVMNRPYAQYCAKIKRVGLLVSQPSTYIPGAHGRPSMIARATLMPKLDDQISTLQEKLHQLKLRQQRLDARKRAMEAQRERKAATRRQILVGGIVLAKVARGEIDQEQFRDWLDQALIRADDRALFGLSPRPG